MAQAIAAVTCEKVVVENAVDGDVTYYRDADSVHHVPKRPLDEFIVSVE